MRINQRRFLSLNVSLAVIVLSLTASVRAGDGESATWYVSPQGNDVWSGRLAQPDAVKSDGPFASLERARDEIRRQKAVGTLKSGATILIREGTYRLAEPFLLEPQDSGNPDAPIIYAAAAGSHPVISGGRAITGWTKGQGNLWQVTLPEVAAGTWYFHELFVDGQRRTRARAPSEGFFRNEGPLQEYKHDQTNAKGNQEVRLGFKFKPGEISGRWRNLQDVNIVLYHAWTNSLHWIDKIDENARTVRFTNPCEWPVCWWEPNQRYFVDNVREALDTPGQWYLDRKTGLLEYYPLPGEDPARIEAVATVLTQLVRFEGKWEDTHLVHDVVLRGLAFEHADWSFPDKRQHLDGQSAFFCPAAIQARGVERITLESCEIAHVGGYGVWLESGCKHNRIAQCELHDLGAGGVRLGENRRHPPQKQFASPGKKPPAAKPVGAGVPAGFEGNEPCDTGHNVVDNNFIHDGGRVFAAGTGIFLGHTAYNQLTHNEISDLNYSGICVGWVWGFGLSAAHHNRVADNHIHHLGWGVLSDMGGVYTLGPSPGTEVVHNLIHHVNAYSYGGWGLYTDEGSSGILLENNLVYDTKSGGFHQHYGADNLIRNNIFAFSRETQIRRSREDLKNSLDLQRNLIYCDNDQVLTQIWKNGDYHVDNNVYWTTAKADPLFDGRTFDQWRATSGQDHHSLLADPQFVDAAGRDFRLRPDSPAAQVGFKPFEMTGFGLYGEQQWVERPAKVIRPDFVLPATAAPTPTSIADDFETTAVGQRAAGAVVAGEGTGASIRVSDELAAGGKHSLKFTDAPDLPQRYFPMMHYVLNCRKGQIAEAFDVHLGPGAVLHHEWRDSDRPYHAGPALHFEGNDDLMAGRQKLLKFPRDTWIHVEIICGVGPEATGTYDVLLTVPGRPPRRFERLPLTSQDFRCLQWCGFVANADTTAVFYIDNLKLGPVKKEK